MHIHDAIIYIAKEITVPLSASNKSSTACSLKKKMKQSKHKMIDLYFQSSPPLTWVMDFFIYQQLSLSFNVCPARSVLRFKCCVKQIPALMFLCHLQPMFFSCRRSRTGPRCAHRGSCAVLVVLGAVLNAELRTQPGAAPALGT